MASQWQACPHCKVLFQSDTAKTPPPRQCPSCKGALPAPMAALVKAPVAQMVGATPGDSRPPLATEAKRSVPTSPPLALGWYYAREKKKHGPVPFVHLQQLAAAGKLGGDDMLLQEGTQKWLPARSVAGVFPAPSVNGVPAKPTSAGSPTKPTSSGWHYAKDKKRHGPVTRILLEQLAATGQLLREDMVLPAGGAKWVSAASIDGLFPSVSVEELAGLVGAAPLETPKLPPRQRPTSPRACTHCKGTAYCGRHWDADGLLARGVVCARCREKSGMAAGQAADKVTCSLCSGKGFVPEEDDASGPPLRRDAVAWRLRGLAFSDSGKYPEAVTAYNEALRLEPDFADAYYERGWAYLAVGQTDQGEADLAEAARLDERFRTSQDSSTEVTGKAGGWLPRLFRR